jgi:hypothetical protein
MGGILLLIVYMTSALNIIVTMAMVPYGTSGTALKDVALILVVLFPLSLVML